MNAGMRRCKVIFVKKRYRIPYRVEIRSFTEPFFREIALVMKRGGASSVAVQRFVQYLEYRD